MISHHLSMPNLKQTMILNEVADVVLENINRCIMAQVYRNTAADVSVIYTYVYKNYCGLDNIV